MIPVGLIGTENLQPADSKAVKPQHFTMKVGEPLYFEKTGPDHSLPARRQVTDRIMDAIAELSGQERSTSYNQSKASSSARPPCRRRPARRCRATAATAAGSVDWKRGRSSELPTPDG